MSKNLISEQFVRELNRWRRSLEQDIERRLTALERVRIAVKEKDVRFGVTVGYDQGLDEEDPSHYPAAGSNTFWVKLGEPSYTQSPGDQTLSVTPYDPVEYRLARTLTGTFVEEGSILCLLLSHGLYFAWPVPEIVTVMTNVRINSTDFEKKTRDMAVWPDGDESDWINWHEGAPCEGA